ncbi:MAG: dihydroorotate dehydrogenase [candidate division WOR-3 bacterium]|jgi:dihydroorotate dehydrogenase (NAD+) catalytic subunit
MNLKTVLKDVEFANPLLAASGTFGFGSEFLRVANRLGGVVTKAVTIDPRAGNPPPRIAEFCGGIVNSVGLENPGLEQFKTRLIPKLLKLKCRLIVNIAGFTPEEFCRLTEALDEEKITGLELNLSCPNVCAGGAILGQNPQTVEKITAAVRKRTRKLLIVKLTANFVDPAETARAAEAGGADAVTIINTLFGLVLDDDGKPLLGGRTGGVSGPAIKPFALYCVDRVAGAVSIPVIGSGGIVSGRDAFEFICAGAKLIEVGTANLIAPDQSLKILTELKAICRQKRINKLEAVLGKTRRTNDQTDSGSQC